MNSKANEKSIRMGLKSEMSITLVINEVLCEVIILVCDIGVTQYTYVYIHIKTIKIHIAYLLSFIRVEGT